MIYQCGVATKPLTNSIRIHLLICFSPKLHRFTMDWLLFNRFFACSSFRLIHRIFPSFTEFFSLCVCESSVYFFSLSKRDFPNTKKVFCIAMWLQFTFGTFEEIRFCVASKELIFATKRKHRLSFDLAMNWW